ncbi:MAG: response regulator transcription factor [Gemmatimonadota bacterium]|nr:response regulator transcription factor [Gemmatimonadota bacterium]
MKEAGTAADESAVRTRVLVVEDDPGIAAVVAYQLARAGYRVETVATGTEGLESLQREIPDLVVLDRMLPGLSGDELLKLVRRDPATAAVPVLVLTAKRERADRIEGLEMGADDYLTKPFSPRELVLRVDAILRRARSDGLAPAGEGRILRAADLRVNLGSMRVTLAGAEVRLTPTEFRLLTALLEKRGRTLSRERLLREAWRTDPDAARRINTRTVDMHIRRLRTKLGSAGARIETVRGFGYLLRVSQ